MNFLEEKPFTFARPEMRQLRDLFVQAYPRIRKAEELADQAGLLPGTFPERDNALATWTELLREMFNQNKLRTLVEIAAADPTVSTYQRSFVEMLQVNPPLAVQTTLTTTDWWKGERGPAAVTVYEERLLMQRRRFFQIDTARRVAEAARSVARLELSFMKQRARGTGFLIGSGLLLTNQHNVVKAEYGPLQDVLCQFDCEEELSDAAKLVRRGKIDTIRTGTKVDWAVIELDQPVDCPPLPLGTPWHIGLNDSIIIIQHPLGAFKQFAIDALSVRYVDEEEIHYLSDTQKGSSGSPVFNERLHVIALHRGEREANISVNGKEEVEWRNLGIAMPRIMKELSAHGIPYERNETF